MRIPYAPKDLVPGVQPYAPKDLSKVFIAEKPYAALCGSLDYQLFQAKTLVNLMPQFFR